MISSQWKRPKTYWLLLNFILLTSPIFLPSLPDGFWGNVIGFCYATIIFLSYPLCVLPVNLLYWLGATNGSIGSLYFQMLICFAAGYFQWFVLVPHLTKFIKQAFIRRDLQINLDAIVANAKPMLDEKVNASTKDWQKNWYDTQKRTPVERLFEKDED